MRLSRVRLQTIIDQLCKAKIEQFGLTLRGNEDVTRFNVDVNSLPHNIQIQGNRVGVSQTGDQLSNGYGIYIRNAADTVVGGDDQTLGNVVGNNLNDGIRLFKPLTTNSNVSHNFVGVSREGDLIPNVGDGISADGVNELTLAYNTIAGNQGNGVHLANMGPQTSGRPKGPIGNVAKIIGNVIGGFPDPYTGELTAIGNQLNGILTEGVSNLQLGSALLPQIDANVIIANLQKGILINGGESNKIENSLVGTTPQGAQNMGNGEDGLKVVGSLFVEINKNTVSGNGGNGISISQLPSQQSGGFMAKLTANIVGLSPQPLGGFRFKIPNLEMGCLFEDVNRLSMKASDAILRNLVGGNNGPGIVLRGKSSDNEISGTIIGTDENGSPGLGNQLGLVIEGANNTAVGNINTALKTVVSGNAFDGLKIVGGNAIQNLIKNCEFKQNGSNGVLITNGASLNTIGGLEENAGNLISENGGSGVLIDETAGSGNVVDPNVIYGNTGLGIDLGSPGGTPNDPGDADSGPNNLQNYPEFISALIGPNGDLIVTYKVDSDPANSNYGSNGLYIEFFKADSSSNLQEQTFLGNANYTQANYFGSLPGPAVVNLGNANSLGIHVGNKIVATATDADGNTSEFTGTNVGLVVGPTAAGVSVSGWVLLSETQGIGNARLTLVSGDGQTQMAITNAFGHFSFNNVQVGRTYVLTVSHKNHAFSNPSRLITVADELTDIDFTASP